MEIIVHLITIPQQVQVLVILLTALIILLRELLLLLTVIPQEVIILRLLTHMARPVIMVRLLPITLLIRHQALYRVQGPRLSLRVNVHPVSTGCLTPAVGVCQMVILMCQAGLLVAFLILPT